MDSRRNAFPFVDLLHALLNTGCSEANSKNKIRSTPWLLHSVMTLAAERLGTSFILSLGFKYMLRSRLNVLLLFSVRSHTKWLFNATSAQNLVVAI